jgi:hypothetical protein
MNILVDSYACAIIFNKPKLTGCRPSQAACVDIAREVQASDDPKDFERTFKKVAKPPKPNPGPPTEAAYLRSKITGILPISLPASSRATTRQWFPEVVVRAKSFATNSAWCIAA